MTQFDRNPTVAREGWQLVVGGHGIRALYARSEFRPIHR